MHKLTKDKLAADVAADCNLSLAAAMDAVQSVCNSIEESLRAGHKVEIRGLFSLIPGVSKARVGRNPKTGAVVPIPERVTVKLRVHCPLPILAAPAPAPAPTEATT